MPRLGEYLCERKLVTAAQVEEAVQHQVLYGGRLGTNLVDLNRVSVDELAQGLAQLHSTALPTYAWLENPDPAAVRKVSRPLVEKHRFVPLRLEGRLLHVAVMDPHDPIMLDELRFATGCRLKVYVLPELLMHDWLEWLFRVPRTIRHVDTNRTPVREGAQGKARTGGAQGEKSPRPADTAKSQVDMGAWREGSDGASGAPRSRTGGKPGDGQAAGLRDAQGRDAAEHGAGGPWDPDRVTPVTQEVPTSETGGTRAEQALAGTDGAAPAATDSAAPAAPAVTDGAAPAAPAATDGAAPATTDGAAQLTTDDGALLATDDGALLATDDGALLASEQAALAAPPSPAAVGEYERQMALSEDREGLIEQALMAATGFASYAALLVVHQGMVEGQAGCRAGFTPEPIGGVLVPISADSEFARLARSAEPQRVELGKNQFDARMLERLGRAETQAAAMFPIALRGRVINVLYADNGSEHLSESGIAALARLAELIGEAYASLILRRKGREVSFSGDQPSPKPLSVPLGALTKASD